MKEIDNILRILRETKKAIEEGRSSDLKTLSNQTIHSATISQDPDNIIVAVVVYVLGKLTERETYRSIPGWGEFYSSTLSSISSSISALENEDVDKFRLHMGKIRNSINKIDGDLRVYIQDVFRKAEINKAFKIYEHGLSSERTADLLGISLWDLASYIGQSSVTDSKVSVSMPVAKRIKLAEDFFR